MTKQRPGETFEAWFARDVAAQQAKEQWNRAQGLNDGLGRPHDQEPDWNQWNPLPPMVGGSAASWPRVEPPGWLKERLPPRSTWAPPMPVPGTPASEVPLFDHY